MLFDRFIFVLYILFNYIWFLIGYEYDSPLKYTPIILLFLSLGMTCIITLLQIQIILKQYRFKSHEIWATVLWSVIHMFICVLIIADALEMANILVIGMISGLLLTAIIITVGTCSCYVIMLNGEEWYAHVHLTCISFWILVQFMNVRLPSSELHYTTSVPIACMALLRMVEFYFEGFDRKTILEALLWVICIFLHVFSESGGMTKLTFLWGSVVTLIGIIIFNKYVFASITIISLPFIAIPICFYVLEKKRQGVAFEKTFQQLSNLYEKWTAVPENEHLPFETEETDEDWTMPL